MEKIFNNIEFDQIISLGHNCAIANALIDISAREYSYPFDWNFTSIDYIIECFNTRFNLFFDKKTLTKSSKGTLNGPKYKNLITFVHSGHYDTLMADEQLFETQYQLFQRRISRLYDKLETPSNNILFVITGYFATVENINTLIDTIKSQNFNSTIKLLVFTKNNKSLFEINNRQDNFCFVYDVPEYCRWEFGGFIQNHCNYKKYPKLNKNKSSYNVI
jgi:hypothetical protein